MSAPVKYLSAPGWEALVNSYLKDLGEVPIRAPESAYFWKQALSAKDTAEAIAADRRRHRGRE